MLTKDHHHHPGKCFSRKIWKMSWFSWICVFDYADHPRKGQVLGGKGQLMVKWIIFALGTTLQLLNVDWKLHKVDPIRWRREIFQYISPSQNMIFWDPYVQYVCLVCLLQSVQFGGFEEFKILCVITQFWAWGSSLNCQISDFQNVSKMLVPVADASVTNRQTSNARQTYFTGYDQ